MDIDSSTCASFLESNIKYREILLDIYNKTLYLSRNDILSNIEEKIREWKLTRLNRPLFIYLPSEKYGSEHYLYYHFQDILPNHETCMGRGIPECELLHLNDIFLDTNIPSAGCITAETTTIITCVISKEIIRKLEIQHSQQDLRIYSTYQVDPYNYICEESSTLFEEFNDEIISEHYDQEFYPVCLTYKKTFLYKDCIRDDLSIHTSLKTGCINIYDDIKDFKYGFKINRREIWKVLSMYAKFKNIPYCSKIDHKLIIEFKDDYYDDYYDYSRRNYSIDRSEENELLRDIITKSDSSIIIVYVSLRIVGYLSAHANLVIINKFLKTYELFEPHGPDDNKTFNRIYNTNKVVKNALRGYLPDYYFIPIYEFCSYGPQDKFEKYFNESDPSICCILCILYGALTILNPDFEQSEIVEELNHMISYPDFDITLRKFNSLCEHLIKFKSK